jgi:hypothetical protein
MSRYEVSRVIRSGIRLGEEIEIGGIRFRPVTPFRSDDVVVSETIEADAFRDASKLFDQHLLPLVDAVTVMTGAPLAPLGASTLIRKMRSKYVYLHAVERRPGGHMTVHPSFHKELLDRSANAAAQLSHAPNLRSAAYYLRRAALAESVLTATFQALQAAEALSTVGRTTNRSHLRTLMGDELYGYFYTRDPVLRDNRRNALAHGRLVDEEGLSKRTTELQERLLGDLRNSLGGTDTRAFRPVHGFVVFEPHILFLEPIDPLPQLPDLVDAAIRGNLHSASDPRWVGGEVSQRLWRRW